MKILRLISVLFILAPCVFAQDKASLDGLTEAILVDNRPVLRILTRKAGTSEVRLGSRDGKEALIFEAWKVPNKSGRFYVTKTKVTFDPDGNMSNFFTYLRTQIKRFELLEKSALLHPSSLIKLEVVPDDNKFVYMRFPNEPQPNKNFAIPGNSLILRSLQDFDAAVAEFHKLTASVAPPKMVEEDEPDAEPEVSDRYDRFQDITVVSTSKMTLRSGSRSIRFGAQYDFPGKEQKKPANAALTFIASAPRAVFREDGLRLNFLVDGERVSVSDVRIADEQATASAVRQTVTANVPFDVLERLAKAKTIEFQIATYEYKLSEAHIKALADLVTYKVEK